ncbi:hypothetical protein PN462_12970 [Spirulina sp. CS-785/01]|uniref:hypothetical protein n=1 Tax=Spirulina sp. CS-785/01 TaxID=3021716 RepID=UPI00232B0089|nr:hypothetical protein [Spirulina sp. CS-785/01]MDB9314018.1 hypothetical protein [Spirulina sp. CS-785/01]
MTYSQPPIYAPSLYCFSYQLYQGLVIYLENDDTSPSQPPIYAPSLYCFSYQLYQGLVIYLENDDTSPRSSKNQKEVKINWIEQEYNRVFKAFGIDFQRFLRNSKLELKQPEKSGHLNLLFSPKSSQRKRQKNFKFSDQNFKGFVHPKVIHDTYAFNLRIAYPEEFGQDQYTLADLQKLNPHNCFQPHAQTTSGYLGQTLLLTTYLNQTPPQNLRNLDKLAQDCWLNFFGLHHPEKIAQFPRLYRVYHLFGGYLYEYGNPEDRLTENPYGHLLIWFFFDGSSTEILSRCYWQLPELFLYYHKIKNTFQDSRIFYQKADKIVNENEKHLTRFDVHYIQGGKESLSDEDLSHLKRTLKTLLKTSLAYSQQLRNLEYARNTIAINSKNYQATLNHIEQLAQAPVEAFRVFADKEAIAFQDQIHADLNYFKQGSSLLDKAIASLRGLVEIDQAERDRQWQNYEKQEQKRQEDAEKDLQDNIQAIGVGVASGAIVASSSGVITETWVWPNNEKIDPPIPLPHPFLIAVFGSSLIAFLCWRYTKHFLKKRRSRNHPNQ